MPSRSLARHENKSPTAHACGSLSWLLRRSSIGRGTERPFHAGLASQHRPDRRARNQGPETAAGTYRGARHHRTCRTGRKPARTNSARHPCGARRLIENHGRTRTIVDGLAGLHQREIRVRKIWKGRPCGRPFRPVVRPPILVRSGACGRNSIVAHGLSPAPRRLRSRKGRLQEPGLLDARLPAADKSQGLRRLLPPFSGTMFAAAANSRRRQS